MSAISIAEHRMTLRNGVTIAYFDSMPAPSADGGAVMVLLHGFCGSSAYWERVIPLLPQEMRIIAPDLRGHGCSETAPATEISMIERYAEDTAEMLDRLNTGQVYLLGHSLGGYIALAFAERFAAKLAGFGLIHSTSMPDKGEAKAGRDKAVAAIRQDGISAFVEGLVPKLFAADNKAAMADDVQRVLEIGRGTGAEGAAQAALAMKARPDRTDILRQTAVPVLLVAGESDGVVPPERTFLKEGPGVMQVMLSHTGHMGMYEHPSGLAEAVRAFVGS